ASPPARRSIMPAPAGCRHGRAARSGAPVAVAPARAQATRSGGPWVARSDASSQVEGALDGAGLALVDEREERVAPPLEREAVREHPRQVDAAVPHEVEVVSHRVLPDAVDLL